MKVTDMTTVHSYTGLSTCGCTAFAIVGQPNRLRDRRRFKWSATVMAYGGPCRLDGPDGLEVLGHATFASEAEAIAFIENGDWPGVVWFRDV
jgi:hypothetical protein